MNNALFTPLTFAFCLMGYFVITLWKTGPFKWKYRINSINRVLGGSIFLMGVMEIALSAGHVHRFPEWADDIILVSAGLGMAAGAIMVKSTFDRRQKKLDEIFRRQG